MNIKNSVFKIYRGFTLVLVAENLWNAQLPQSFRRNAQNSIETALFQKIPTPGNKGKFRCLMQCMERKLEPK